MKGDIGGCVTSRQGHRDRWWYMGMYCRGEFSYIGSMTHNTERTQNKRINQSYKYVLEKCKLLYTICYVLSTIYCILLTLCFIICTVYHILDTTYTMIYYIHYDKANTTSNNNTNTNTNTIPYHDI